MATMDRTITTPRQWDQFEETYRSDWENRYGADRKWHDFQPAYRYGWEAYGNDRFHNRDWSEIENDLQKDWPEYYKKYSEGMGSNAWTDDLANSWNHYRDAIHEGWQRARLEWDH